MHDDYRPGQNEPLESEDRDDIDAPQAPLPDAPAAKPAPKQSLFMDILLGILILNGSSALVALIWNTFSGQSSVELSGWPVQCIEEGP